MATGAVSAGDLSRQASVKEHWGMFLALGIALVILGAMAISSPYLGTISATRVLGWVMLFTGALTAFHGGTVRGWGGAILQLLVALLYIVAGIWLLTQPLSGAVTLTLVLIAILIGQGVIWIAEAFQIRPIRGWIWLLLSGIISIILGLMIWQKFPSSAVWALGLLFGTGLLVNGLSFIFMALGSRDSLSEAKS